MSWPTLLILGGWLVLIAAIPRELRIDRELKEHYARAGRQQ